MSSKWGEREFWATILGSGGLIVEQYLGVEPEVVGEVVTSVQSGNIKYVVAIVISYILSRTMVKYARAKNGK